MKTYPLPHTDLQVSRIAYGCMKIGGSWDRNEPLTADQKMAAMRVVRAALDEGINFFDHADIYCAGKSEIAFSQVWQEVPNLRQKIVLQSKCGIRFGGQPQADDPGRFDFSYSHIIGSVEQILKRLQTDYLDILLLHRPDPLVEPEEVAKAFDELHQSGKVRHFGVSNHNVQQLELLRHYLNQPIVANQVEISLLHNQLIDEGVVFNQLKPAVAYRGMGTLEYCRLNNIMLQAWGPLASGGVLGGPNAKSDISRATGQVVSDLAQAKGTSPEAVALAWLLRHPAHIQPIIGTTNPEHLKVACLADQVELTREEWYKLFIAGRGAPMP